MEEIKAEETVAVQSESEPVTEASEEKMMAPAKKTRKKRVAKKQAKKQVEKPVKAVKVKATDETEHCAIRLWEIFIQSQLPGRPRKLDAWVGVEDPKKDGLVRGFRAIARALLEGKLKIIGGRLVAQK
jgi:hypothetical protein